MQRFADFVAGEASKAADAAQAALLTEVAALQDIVIPRKRDAENALADYRKLGDKTEEIAAKIIAYFGKGEARRAALGGAVQTRELEPVDEIPEEIGTALDAELAWLEARAVEYAQAAATGNAKRMADGERLIQLKDQRELFEDLETVLTRLADLKIAAKVTKCREFVNTGQVSNKITDRRCELFTKELEKRIQKAIKTLDLTDLAFGISDRSAGGKYLWRVP